jgi:hypothetical protein
MTPATVVHAFARAGVPVVRYAQSASLCSREVCRSLDYAGDGVVAFLAPGTKPQFEIVILRTQADARTIAALVHGRRHANAVLVQLVRRRQIEAIFDRMRP